MGGEGQTFCVAGCLLLQRRLLTLSPTSPSTDLIARCEPGSGASNGVPYGLVTSAICTSTDIARIREGFRSFPSGHASSGLTISISGKEADDPATGLLIVYSGAENLFPTSRNSLAAAFAGLGFFGFYLAGKMHLFDQRGHAIKAWIAMVPFLGAATIALTRTMDYRHHATE